MSERRDQHAAIFWLASSDGERYGGYDGARIDCPRCEEAGGWDGGDSGMSCPYGCGVRIFSNQPERDAQYHQEETVREAVRRDARAARKAKEGP